MLGPDGKFELLPLRVVEVDAADLAVLARAAAALGHALATEPSSELVEAMTVGAEAAAPTTGPPPSPRDLVEGLARAHGLLDLAVTNDTALMIDRLTAGGGADIVLSDQATRNRQNGCPAGSIMTRTSCWGWNAASVAPVCCAQATEAARSVTAMSRCVWSCCWPSAEGHTGATCPASYSKFSVGPTSPSGGRICAHPSCDGKPGLGGSVDVTGQPRSAL